MQRPLRPDHSDQSKSQDSATVSENFLSHGQNEASGGRFDRIHDKKSIRTDNRYKIVMHADDEAMEVCEPADDPLERKDLLATQDQAR